MAADIQPYIDAIEQRIGFALDEPFLDAYEIVVDGTQMVRIYLDADAGSARIVTSIENSPPTLPKQVLAGLLEFNFPNNDTAGAILGADPDGFGLSLINQFSIASISPKALADIALAQGRAAVRVSRWIETQSAQVT